MGGVAGVGGAGGFGGAGARGPQSAQSLPREQTDHSALRPPSSQTASTEYAQQSLQRTLLCEAASQARHAAAGRELEGVAPGQADGSTTKQ